MIFHRFWCSKSHHFLKGTNENQQTHAFNSSQVDKSMCGGLKNLACRKPNLATEMPYMKYQHTARCPHKIPLPLNRSDGTSNFSILGLRMRCICRFHHPAIGVPPMSLLCTGGPGGRGRRGLDPAESCDISWAWRHGPQNFFGPENCRF